MYIIYYRFSTYLFYGIQFKLTACNTDNLAEYKKALEKTEQITKGQFSAELSMEMDYNTDGLTSEEMKNLSYFKNMEGSFNAVHDDEAEKAIFRNYMSFGGLGFDFICILTVKKYL